MLKVSFAVVLLAPSLFFKEHTNIPSLILLKSTSVGILWDF